MSRVNTTRPADLPSATPGSLAQLLSIARWLASVTTGWPLPERMQQLAGRLGEAIDADHAFIARIHASVLPPPVIALVGAKVNRTPLYDTSFSGEALTRHTPELVDRLAGGHVCDLGPPRGPAAKDSSRFHVLAVPVRVAGDLWGLIGFTSRDRAPVDDPEAVDALQLIAVQLGERLGAPAVTAPAAPTTPRSDHDRLLRAAIEGLEDGIVVYDADYRVAAYNKAWRRYTRQVLPGSDLRGMRLADLYREYVHIGTWSERQADEVLRDILAGRSAGIQDRMVEQDGRHIRIRNFRIPGGGIVGLRSDVTETVERERELLSAKDAAEVASRAKSTFLASMSHELRTPLNAIIGFSDVMRQQVFGPLAVDRYREYVADIHRSGSMLLSLINDIMDMARIEAGKMELASERFAIGQIVHEVLPLVKLRAEAKGIALDATLADDLPQVTADRRATTQILLNLVVNAVKFTPHGGKVAISVGRAGDAITVAVSDNGPGIGADDLARLGRPFERLDVEGIQVAAENKGSGLGLAISRALAERQGGALTIESALGVGTTVTLRLPLPPR